MAGLEPFGERGEAGVNGFHDAGAVERLPGLPVQAVGHLVKPPLKVMKQRVAVFDGFALSPLAHACEQVEALLDAPADLAVIGYSPRPLVSFGDGFVLFA